MPSARALPKHLQVSERLIREIAAGKIADGSRLPPERELAQELNVAVGTLRKALSMLQAKGLLKRIQGSGNYVRAKRRIDSIYAFLKLELAEGGGLPTAQPLEVLPLNKPDGAPFFGTAKRAHRIRRVRFLDAHAVALEEIWLDTRVAETLLMSDLQESLYRQYQQAFGVIISRAEDKVSARDWPDWARATPLAETAQRLPLAGYVERLAHDQSDSPVEYSRTWFDPQRAHYVNRDSRIPAARLAA